MYKRHTKTKIKIGLFSKAINHLFLKIKAFCLKNNEMNNLWFTLNCWVLAAKQGRLHSCIQGIMLAYVSKTV